MSLAPLMSSARDTWCTPVEVVELVREVFGGRIGIDPCPNPDSVVDAGVLPLDGLSVDWRPFDSAYVNPPFGRGIRAWTRKMVDEAAKGCEIIALLPARTDAAWFQDLWTAQALCFWRGRMRFLGAPASAPFPSVMAYWGPRPWRFADVFSARGKVVLP